MLSFTTIANPNGGVDVHYGLTDIYTKLGVGTVCANTFYYLFSPNFGDFGLSFGNGVTGVNHFDSMSSAQQYVKSDEYKAIKTMILSLNY